MADETAGYDEPVDPIGDTPTAEPQPQKATDICSLCHWMRGSHTPNNNCPGGRGSKFQQSLPDSVQHIGGGFEYLGQRIAELGTEQLEFVAANNDPSGMLPPFAGVQSAFMEALWSRARITQLEAALTEARALKEAK